MESIILNCNTSFYVKKTVCHLLIALKESSFPSRKKKYGHTIFCHYGMSISKMSHNFLLICRSFFLPRWSNYDIQGYQKSSAAASLVHSHNSGTGISARISRSQDSKIVRSSPSPNMGEEVSRHSSRFSIKR